MTFNVREATGTGLTALEKPNANGRASAASSRPVALSNEDLAAVNAIATILGAVTASPTANTIGDRLKTIATALTTLAGYEDGLETLLTTLNGYVDGLEGLATSLNGYVDGLETLVTSTNTKSDTLHTDLAAILAKLIASPSTETTLTAFSAKLPSSLGIKTASNSLSVAPASDGLFTIPFSRSLEVSGTFTPSTSYSAAQSIGATGGGNAVLTIGGFPAGSRVRPTKVVVSLTAAGYPAIANIIASFWNASPSATVNEASTPTFTAADAAKIRTAVSMGNLGAWASMANWTGVPSGELTADGSGNIYLVLTAVGTQTFTTPGIATWTVAVAY